MISLGELLIIGIACSAFLGLAVFSIWVIVTLVRGTQNKTNMGINLSASNVCPTCQTPLPSVRVPKGMRQLLFGGWTCTKCGAEVDKWGRLIPK